MGFMSAFVTWGCKFGLSFKYKVVREGWENLPDTGPFILYANHTGIIEAPIFYTQIRPRPITGLAKAEIWDNPFLSFVFKLWQIIPVRRGESDMDSMRKVTEALKAGKILGMAPEGTRSKTGKLLRAQLGVAFLALHTQSPLLPMAHWGGMKEEGERTRFGRKVFHIRAGRPFRLDAGGERVNKDVRQAMADEMMYQVAMLLPEEKRGEYADLSKATTRYLRFLDRTSG